MKTWFLAILACILGSFLWVACNEEVETPTNEIPAVVSTGHPSIAALTQKIPESPQSPDLYAARAGIYYENEGYDEAIQDLQMALRLDSTNIDYQSPWLMFIWIIIGLKRRLKPWNGQLLCIQSEFLPS